MLKLILFATIGSVFAFSTSHAQQASQVNSPPAFGNEFEEKIRPLLLKYCADCHVPGEWGARDFFAAKTQSDLAGLRGLYVDVVAEMDRRSMPPGNSDQPSEQERKLVTDWIKKTLELKPKDFDRIAKYVVEVYEDQQGNLWFGTMHKGAARFDGRKLVWFSKKDGLPSNSVPSFAEDKDGQLWVGTQEGVCRFDGNRFIQFGSEKGLPPRYGRVLADNDGNIWAGMNTGVFRFDGSSFSEFKVPVDKDKISSHAIIPGQVSLALHDKKGNLWFSTDGYGAFRYDGTSFTHFTKDDGLCSNNVTSIMEDRTGNIWFTCIQSYQPKMTGDGGVCRYDGKAFTKFPNVKGLSNNDIYTIYEAKDGNIWIGASGHGVYRYNPSDSPVGSRFTLYNETDRKHWTRNFGLQGMVQDRNGTLWFGFSGGLFRFNGKSFLNVTQDGPWSVSTQASQSNNANSQTNKKNVDALLNRLQPSGIVVEGDPREKTTIDELLRAHHTPGASVAVIRNGKVDWAAGFGMADVEAQRKVEPTTLFQAASITKPVTAAAALSMVQAGLLDLDENVNLKLKSWKLPENEFTQKQPVTLRQLLSHTAGTTVHGFPGYASDVRLPTMVDILDGRGNVDSVRVDTLPGSKGRYSGGGYTIVAQLMSDVAGKPFPEVVKEHVLAPAGMVHSTYVQPLPTERENDAATAYNSVGMAIKGRYHHYPGGGGLWTTPTDLARFAIAIQRSSAEKPGSLLSKHLVDTMLKPVMENYGLGLQLSQDGNRFGHSGANAGYLCLLSASIKDGWGVVVMTNGDRGWHVCEMVRMAAAQAYDWSAFEPTIRKRVDIGEDALERLAGTYECLPEWSHARSRLALFPNMGTLEFKAVNGRLIADVPEGARTEGRVEFLPQSELQLLQRRNGRLMDFIVNDGKVTGFKFRGFEARRVDKTSSLPQDVDSATEPLAKRVTALLEKLQPDIMVVDGDPIEQTTIEEMMSNHHVPGASIAVIRNGQIDWTRGFGLADVGTGRPVTRKTLFQAASISVPVAAAAALSMVEDGLLDLDEDVNEKLKTWKLPANEFTEKQPVTLRHLLSHTAGTNVLGLPGYARGTKLPSTVDVLNGRGNTGPVLVGSPPGKDWRYSDGGYVIIGQLLQDVAGKPFAEIVREHVFEPTGMKHSTYQQPLPPELEKQAATAYARDGTEIQGRYRNYPEIGAAGLWTTPEDLAKFVLAIQRSRSGKPNSLLSAQLAREMLKPVMNRYGLGVYLSEDGKRFGHGGTNRGFRIRGSNRGFRTRVSASIDEGWGIIVMTNGDGGSALCELVPIAAAKAYGWSENLLLDAYGTYGPIRRKRVDIGDAALARLAGTYECLPEWSHAVSRRALFPNMGTVELKVMNGRLIADVPRSSGTERFEFLPQSEFQAMQRRNGLLMDFIVKEGQVSGFKFREVEARRVSK